MDDLNNQNRRLKLATDSLMEQELIAPSEPSPLDFKRDPFQQPQLQQPVAPIQTPTLDPKKLQPKVGSFSPAPDIEIPEQIPLYTESKDYKDILSRLESLKPEADLQGLTEAQGDRNSRMGAALLMQAGSDYARNVAKIGGTDLGKDNVVEGLKAQITQQFNDYKEQTQLKSDAKKEERKQLLEKLDLLKQQYKEGKIARNDFIEESKLTRDQVRQNRQDEQNFKQNVYKLDDLKNQAVSKKIDLNKKIDENDPESAISQYARLQAEQQINATKQMQKSMGLPVDESSLKVPQNATAAQLKEMGLYKGQGTDSLRLLSMLQRDRDLELKERAEDRRLKGQEFTQAQKNELSDKQVKDITSQDTAIKFIDDIRGFKKQNKIDTGQVSDKQNRLAQMVNLDDPKVSTFRAMVGQQLAEYIKSISGAAVSDKEREVLEKLIPKMDDSNATFDAKLGQLQDKLRSFKDVELKNIQKAQGKDVSKLASPEPKSDLVTIQGPSGQTVKMKKENAEKYLSKPGYRILE